MLITNDYAPQRNFALNGKLSVGVITSRVLSGPEAKNADLAMIADFSAIRGNVGLAITVCYKWSYKSRRAVMDNSSHKFYKKIYFFTQQSRVGRRH
jgi:hypothetical protein